MNKDINEYEDIEDEDMNEGGDPYRSDWDEDDDEEEEEEDARWIGQASSAEEAERRWNIVRMRGIHDDEDDE